MTILLLTLITLLVFFCFSLTNSQNCVSIDQPDDAYLHEPTTLNCEVGTGAVGDSYYIAWYLNNRSARTRKYLSYVTEEGVTINQNFSWKIASEWDGVFAVFSLTIENTTLMDGGAYTEWECDKTGGNCIGNAFHAFDVKPGKM